MTNTIFNGDKSDQTAAPQDGSAFNGADAQSTPTPIDALVGEGKKYATVEVLAESRIAADKHIEKLEAEMTVLRDAATASTSRQDILDELKSLTSATPTQPQTENVTNDASQTQSTVGNEETVSQLVKQSLAQERADNTASSNEMKVSDKLRQKYGDTVDKVLQDKAVELGVSVNELQADAQRSPSKLLALFGINGTAAQAAPTAVLPTNSVNTSTPEFKLGGEAPVGSKEYFEKMRKDNPREYSKPGTQAAIMKAHADGLYGDLSK